eukprot:364942-Chlamydomonas_euryale.AAC.2
MSGHFSGSAKDSSTAPCAPSQVKSKALREPKLSEVLAISFTNVFNKHWGSSMDTIAQSASKYVKFVHEGSDTDPAQHKIQKKWDNPAPKVSRCGFESSLSIRPCSEAIIHKGNATCTTGKRARSP